MNDRVDLRLGDCLHVLKSIPDCSVDAVVCDPPYHLTSIVKRFGGANAAPAQFGTDGAFARASRGFMGQQWDGGDIAFRVETWAELLRVLKPGGHLLAFSGARTYHRMTCAIEDAGSEIRDQIMWLYGSGFPKSLSVAKAIAKGTDTDPAQQWDGWGTALKPSHEPICMARKPLTGTVAQNVLRYGTGGLHIDACRVEAADGEALVTFDRVSGDRPRDQYRTGTGVNRREAERGRWPSNLLHDGSDDVLAAFAEYGERGASAPVKGTEASAASIGRVTGQRDRVPGVFHDDTGTAARFFYCAKASQSDRSEGLDGDNPHPTVKPTELMRWLCRLVTPPGGLVLDPFMGSGSTGKAAMLEGFRFIGIEREQSYFAVAEARIAHAIQMAEENARAQAKAERERLDAERQLDMFMENT